MRQSIFSVNNYTKNPRCSENFSGKVHSCPYCRCKSLDYSVGMYQKPYVESSTKHSSNDLFMSNPNLSKIFINPLPKQQTTRNAHYQSYNNLNNRESVSSNFNNKIVIKYFSPVTQNAENFKQRVSTPYISQRIVEKNDIKRSSPNLSPRTIYTNQNTPPKAKFLLKRQSKKRSLQKLTFQPSFQPIKSLQINSVEKPIIQVQKPTEQIVSEPFQKPMEQIIYEPFRLLSMQDFQKKISLQKSQQIISPFKNADYLEGIIRTQTKNVIGQQKIQTTPSSRSPFNSLVDTTPQILPFGSFQSTPLIQHQIPEKIQKQASINQIMQFHDEQQEVKSNRIISYPAEIQKYQFQPKQIQIQKQLFSMQENNDSKKYSKNDFQQKFVTENQFIYSESDKKTIQNQTNSQQYLLQGKHFKFNSHQTQSQRNLRATQSNFEKKKTSKFDFIELSDNCQTPRSKYKGGRDSKISDSKKSIKFKVIGENRKSKISVGSVQSINQLMAETKKKQFSEKKEKVNSQEIQDEDFRQFLKPQSFIKEKREQVHYLQAKNSDNLQNQLMINNDQQQKQRKQASIETVEVKTVELQDSLSKRIPKDSQSNKQGLKINYDYYCFEIGRNIFTNGPGKSNWIAEQSASSASTHGPINISF